MPNSHPRSWNGLDLSRELKVAGAGTLSPNPEPIAALGFRGSMDTHIAPVFSRWKPVGLWLLLALTLPAAMLIGAEPADADGLRQQAVSQYIDGATKELEAFGQELVEAARPDNQQQCREARAKLGACNELLADLKTAGPDQFDRVKANYERTRAEFVKALQAAQTK